MLLAAFALTKPAAQSPHLDSTERDGIEAALTAGSTWLVQRIGGDGRIVPTEDRVCPVATTALALWALADAGRTKVSDLAQLARFLRRHAQGDGGLYDPQRGLAVYTSGVAAASLRAYCARVAVEPDDTIRAAELYAQRATAPESLTDAARILPPPAADLPSRARDLLARGGTLDDGERRAAEFLAAMAPAAVRPQARVRPPEPRPNDPLDLSRFSYNELLSLVYLSMKPEHQVHLRAMAAIRRDFALDHNPDLTKRYGPAGFNGGSQGLYYYYLVLAKTLAASGSPQLDLADGRRVDWVRSLSSCLLKEQRRDGAWVNDDGRWWEDDATIVTSYALLALRSCRDMPATARASRER